MNFENIGFQDIDSRNTQERFTWAVTYLASGESGRGMNPAKLETAMEYAREWKHNLVKFLIGKPRKGYDGQVHTKQTATETADAIFKFRYEQETQAHQSPTINTYWTREVGELEFGRELQESGKSQYSNRLDEVTTPICRNDRAWTSKQQQKRNYGQLLVYLAQGKNPSKVVRNARNLMRMFAITKEQFENIRTNAGDIHVQAIKAQVAQTDLPV